MAAPPATPEQRLSPPLALPPEATPTPLLTQLPVLRAMLPAQLLQPYQVPVTLMATLTSPMSVTRLTRLKARQQQLVQPLLAMLTPTVPDW
jgi:hypothetical protein